MIKQRFISAVMAAAVAVSSVTALSAGVSAEWVKSDSGYSYKSDDPGKKLTGWQTIGDGTYYFDKKGIALTGWKKIGDDTYYFNSAKKGKMLTGWSKIGSSKYYFGLCETQRRHLLLRQERQDAHRQAEDQRQDL